MTQHTDWRDISSAPKDGDDFTLGLAKGRVVIGCKYCSGGPFRSVSDHARHMVKHPRRKRAS